MAIAIGSIAVVSVGSSTANLLVPAATGGSGAVTYQTYRSTASGFTPGTTTLITGATSLSVADSGLTPGTVYYYETVATDSIGSVASTPQVTVTTTAATPNINSYTTSPILGQLDLRFNGNTIAVQLDGSVNVVAGQSVKFSTTSDQQSPGIFNSTPGMPLVVPCTAASDIACGYVNYNIKDALFVPGDLMEISMEGNVMYLQAALAINRGQSLTNLPSNVAGGTVGGVVPVLGGTVPIVGYALDTSTIGSLVRVMLRTPAAPYAVG